MNIVYLGSSGPLSVMPLRFLISSGHKLLAVGVDSISSSSLRELSGPIIAGMNETVEMLARIHSVPVIQLFDGQNDYVRSISECKPDIIIASCLEKKLPDEVLAIPALGCFNLHPSLLPAYRGPAPLFWQFRQAIEVYGISLHRMNSDFDAGPIISQSSTSMPDGISNENASVLLANLGVEMLKTFLDEFGHKVLRECAQDEALASQMGYPGKQHFRVSTDWSARRIYNFMCATRHWGMAYPCEIMGRPYELEEALSFQADARSKAVFFDEDRIRFACHPGILSARLKSQDER